MDKGVLPWRWHQGGHYCHVMIWCSVAASSRIAGARVLAESLAAVHPGAIVHVVVPDGCERVARSPTRDDGGGKIRLLSPVDVGVDELELRRRRAIYDDEELACSLKAPLMRTLLTDAGEPVVYLDSDVLVTAPLEEVVALAQRHAVVLTPLRTRPMPWASGGSPEELHLRIGVYDAGVIAAGCSGEAFLTWWAERTARDCVRDPRHGLMLDQGWLALAPALFDYAVTRDPGTNVTWHALHDRDVEWCGEEPRIAGRPLRCFHFTGFDPTRADLLAQRVEGLAPPALSERVGVARLVGDYVRRLSAHGGGRRPPSQIAPTPTLGMRRAYRQALHAAEEGRAAEPPLAQDGQPSLDWLAEPAAGTWLSRYVLGRRDERPDLPGLRGRDAALLAIWARDTPEPGAPAELLGVASRHELVPGAPVDAAVVHAFGEALLDGNPAPDDGEAALRWLREPAPPATMASRYVLAVRDLREDLRHAFPRVPGADEPALMAWAARRVGAPPPDTLPALLAGADRG